MQVLLKADGDVTQGGAPLMMHNQRLADPLDPIARSISAVVKKRNKTEADLEEVGFREFIGSLYTFPEIPDLEGVDGQRPVVPARNILRCLMEGATRQKRGKDVPRGVLPLEAYADLIYDGPTEPLQLWKVGGFANRATVRVARARTVRTRPVFTNWKFQLMIEIDPAVFDVDTLTVAWKDAGWLFGIGDQRPIFGRFLGTVEVPK